MVSLFNLPREERKIVFYSEGKAYWPHLKSLLSKLLLRIDIPICYITSGNDDPVQDMKNHPRLRIFETDEGSVRNWLFENLDTDLMVMTMPDLDQFQIKRSRHKVHYVYVQHSMNSLHMMFRTGAFDNFDTIFCAGPHHVKEIRAMEKKYDLPAKICLEHGYERLDTLIEEGEMIGRRKKSPGSPIHILVAPSYGKTAIVETMGEAVVSYLLSKKYEVTLRPHPETWKFSGSKIKQIEKIHGSNPFFHLEKSVSGQSSLHEADLMISDGSGAAIDFSFGLKKPVLYLDMPRKINKPKYKELNIDPFEVWIREKVGDVVSPEKFLKEGDRHIQSLLKSPPSLRKLVEENMFNVGNSAAVGANYLINRLKNKNK